jgi:hypothetical protein
LTYGVKRLKNRSYFRDKALRINAVINYSELKCNSKIYDWEEQHKDEMLTGYLSDQNIRNTGKPQG